MGFTARDVEAKAAMAVKSESIVEEKEFEKIREVFRYITQIRRGEAHSTLVVPACLE